MTDRGLADTVVVDRTTGIAGAYAARLFADAGARVVRVEPSGGDPDRPTALWRFLHHDVESVETGDDVALASAIDAASVLLVSQGEPGLEEFAHDRVVVAITPWGLDGPAKDRPTNSFLLEAESGSLASRGRATRAPFAAGARTWEWITGGYAAAAAVAAVRNLNRTGHGELIDVSMFEATHLAGASFMPLLHQLAGRPTPAAPARVIETPEIHPTLDGWVGFTTNSAQQFRDFLVMIDRTDLAEDEELCAAAGRQRRYDEWTGIVDGWTSQRPTAAIVELARLLRIPVAPVLSPADVFDFDHFVARGVFVPSADGGFSMPRRPWRVVGEEDGSRTRLSKLGEHRPFESRRAPTVRPAGGLPLAGIRVVDLTAWWAGPSSTHLLACLGADVIHVESPTRLDGMRMTGGAFRAAGDWWERSSFFLSVNTNKRGLAVDLGTPAGRDVFDRLVATADIVVENFTPRVLDNLGIGWDHIQQVNPRAILVRMPAFGLDGPWRDSPGFAQTMEQLSGLAWLTGELGGQPHNQRGPCDPHGGVHAAFAAIAAVFDRELDGRGRMIEVPFVEVALNAAAEAIVEYSATGARSTRVGNRSSRAAPQGIYQCARPETWIALSVESDEQWRSLVEAADLTEFVGDASTDRYEDRARHHDAIDAALEAWTSQRSVDDALEVLRRAGVPVARVTDPRSADDHEQFESRGFFEEMTHPIVGRKRFATLPFRFGSVPHWLVQPAPLVGEHTSQVLAELGYSSDEAADLIRAGVAAIGPIGFT